MNHDHHPYDAVDDPNAVAVVGLSCRFGPATSADRLWELLEQGRSGIHHYSPEELVRLGHRPEPVRRPGFVPAGVVLEDADAFDNEFFGYSPVHAEWLDPQQRVLLETAWHALEDAGFAPDRTGLRTAAYVSVGQSTMPQVGITDLDAAGMIRFSSSDKDFAASRISYKLGLTGPSLTVQSACSSGLVAVHLAVESLLGEESDLAVVGAASLHFPQAGYLAAPDMILSPSGECRPFDDGADGTVFGNGAGALVLRRLADAVRDGDPIRAVIRGSAVNNDGARKMDYHAPSPKGQEAVLREALAVAGIDAHTVGYLETHGTGTHLGDPIEYAALDRVYGGARPHPAAIGSVKSVVGHLNTAAGLAGLAKAILALEHAAVPPQAPFEKPNRRLAGTGGLRIAAGGDGWPVPDGPRRAAVSSFGIGGTNAHVVLEQAPDLPAPPAGNDRDEHRVPVSARTEEALRQLAALLADAVSGPGAPELADVAHTLRTGRSHRAVRAVLTARTTAELAEQLRELARAGTAATATPVGPHRAWIEGTGELPEPEPAPGRTGRRVRLPGYPFARRRWPRPDAPDLAPDSRSPEAATDALPVRTVRPDDPLAADHLVGGLPVFPAAAQIDLALTAAGRIAGKPAAGLADLAFRRTVEVVEPVELRVETEDGQVRVASTDVHSQARLLPAGVPERPAPLDLAALRRAYPESAEPEALYRYFADNGVGYGPAFRVLRELHHGPAGVLARVTAAPESVPGETVSPCVLDGALQSVIGCVLREDLAGETFIPFAIDELTVHAPLPGQVWVTVSPQRLAGGGRRVRRYDVAVAAEDGAVLLTLRGLALRPVTAPAAPAAPAVPPGVHLFASTEEEFPPPGRDAATAGPLVLIADTALDGADLVLPAPADPDAAAAAGAELAARLPAGGGRPTIVWPAAADDPHSDPAATATDGALRLLALLRALLRPLGRRGAHLVVPHPAGCPAGAVTGAGLAALGRSLNGENPRFDLTALAVEDGAGTAGLRRALDALTVRVPLSRALTVAADGGLRTTVLAPLTPTAGSRPVLRHGGRYWIHGMGRLAALLAEHLLDRYGARLVLTGRSAPDGARGEELRRLADRAARTGGSVEYRQLDPSDPAAVGDTARRIAADGPAVNGVFHCAGVLRDGYVLRKTVDDAREVIVPKLVGAAELDSATADWDLDCFAVFSSVSGALGSAGQADYAFANAAADELVRRRADRAGRGRSVSIAWPFWADGGMRPDGPALEELATLGMRALPTEAGLAVLESLLAGPATAPVVLYGDREALLASFPLLTSEAPAAVPAPVTAPAPAPVTKQSAPAAAPAGEVTAVLHRRLAAVVAEATRTPVDDVTADRLFDDLGIDSLLAIRVVELLEKDFGRLSKTLLFECRSVEELAEYLREEHPERCAALAGGPKETAAPAAPVAPVAPAQAPAPAVSAMPSGPSADALADPRAVAVIGVAGRFPEADGLDRLWRNLTEGRDSITEVPADRWDAEALYDADKTRVDRTHTKWGGFIHGVENFDAALFNISPREAGIVDPQARLFLESCWAALDDAGYTPDRLVSAAEDPVHRRDVGVFVGAMYGEYQLHEAEERLRGNPVLANSAYWSIANRVSYFFDFQGPSVAVDTACSSALTAVHLAVESLRAGTSRVAIAGGVNVLIHPNKYFMLGQGRFASSDGRCRSFGADGDGYVPGEGVGAVVLKPLRDALRDGDHIHGVIRGSSANHGGRTNGYTVPNPRAQADLVTKALRDAGLTARDLDYIEAHGTGTALGDPIEVRGLASAFARDGVKGPGSLPIGSVKSNVGHLESAAGSVALAKVLLQLRHRTLVPSLHATPPNPEIDFDGVPFSVQQQLAPWRTHDGAARPLRAGISSFGAGGGNAHLIVEEAPAPAPRPAADRREPLVLFLSARTDTALAAYARDLRDHLLRARSAGHEPSAADVAFTFAVGRVDLARRAALPADSLDLLLAGLDALAEGRPQPAPPAGETVAAWLSGRRIDREAASGSASVGRRIPLPHYPFERVRCWYDLQIAHLHRQALDSAGQEPAFARSHLRDFGRAPSDRPQTALPAQTAVPAPGAAPAPAVASTAVPARADVPAAVPAPAAASAAVPALTLRGAGTPARRPATAPDLMEKPQMISDRKISLRPLAPATAATGPAAPPAPAAPVAPAAPAAPAAPPAPAAVPVGRQEEVVEEVARLLAGVLYLEPGRLDPEETFLTLGVDSILGVEFVAAVNAVYPVGVKATALYDHPTPAAFARHVAESLGAPASAPAPVLAPAAAPAPSPVVAVDPAPIADALREELARTLYCEPGDIDDEASFNTLGLDSILGVEFVAFVNQAYGLDEKAGVLYDHPSLAALSRHVAGRAGAAPVAPVAPVRAAAPQAPVLPLPVPGAGEPSQADLDALLSAVRDNRLSIEQAVTLLTPRA
ncbi:beta-ketoacyl synthase N-terminal-like domain-containing protein [Streptomyces sp. NPDC090026]|uniref:beta-ketoacyl synthase N-terminal-like domain-containing protein n=1 Tax=Streptomyces sp. NPDC090026 TaxID=3365923 RepID=UPI0038094C73